MTPDARWLDAMRETVAGYRRMIDGVVRQLTDDELAARPRPGMNSVGVLLRHLGGNLESRFTDFMTADGEKASRDRDREFEDWPGDRASLLAHLDRGWACLDRTLGTLTESDLGRAVRIRGEAHSVPQALVRALAHVASHVGQICIIARLVRDDDASWTWLTIAPGESRQHNAATWGTAASRGIAGGEDESS